MKGFIIFIIALVLGFNASAQTVVVYHNYAQAQPTVTSYPTLDSIAVILTNNPTMRVQLSSHTDCRGTVDYNTKLSQYRAEAVERYLIAKGVRTEQFALYNGYGENYLLNNCKDGVACAEEEHSKNRRTEITFVGRLENDGSVVITHNASPDATGGSSYEWSNGETTAQINGTQSGIYTVTGTDANGCTETATAVVTVNALPTQELCIETINRELSPESWDKCNLKYLDALTGDSLRLEWRRLNRRIRTANSHSCDFAAWEKASNRLRAGRGLKPIAHKTQKTRYAKRAKGKRYKTSKPAHKRGLRGAIIKIIPAASCWRWVQRL